MSLKILVVDDETAARKGLVSLLSGWGYAVEEAADGQEALEKAVADLPSVVITDLVMPRLDGHALLKALREEAPFAAVILLTGQGSIETAVAAMKDGAYDYLTKPVDVARLKLLIPKAASSSEALREVALLRRQLSQVMGMGRLVGTGPAMQEVYRMIEMAAPTPAPVLITGESGTGKELVARTIHELSPRAQAPFVAVNCAAIPETLLESELFGHEKGAFTGALKQKPGRVEEADGGSIFLDEIADMSKPLQAKLLRFLEDGTFTRVGGTQELRVNVRLIAATNRDIAQAIAAGQFREDLFHRLNVVQFPLPPLRERGDDILLLTEHFLRVFRAALNKDVDNLASAAQSRLQAHTWPGNVRELRNVIERALILEKTRSIQPSSLPDFQVEARLQKAALPQPAADESLDDALSRLERELITRALEQHDFNLTRASECLKLTRHALRYRMQRLNMNVGDSAAGETPAPASRSNSES